VIDLSQCYVAKLLNISGGVTAAAAAAAAAARCLQETAVIRQLYSDPDRLSLIYTF
jgi:hypothetical protein